MRALSLLLLAALLQGCGSSPKFSVGALTRDCGADACQVSFDVTSSVDEDVPVYYEISLSQNFVNDPDRSGRLVVGTASGEVSLEALASQTVEVRVPISEAPNGVSVSVVDARTPGLYLRFVNWVLST